MKVLHLEVYIGPPRTEQAERIARLERAVAMAAGLLESDTRAEREKALAILRGVKP